MLMAPHFNETYDQGNSPEFLPFILRAKQILRDAYRLGMSFEKEDPRSMNEHGYKEVLLEEDLARIERAFFISKNAHCWQVRRTGEPYFEHPFAIAKIILEEFHAPTADKVIYALLHDTLEDTQVTKSRLLKEFGEEIMQWVDFLSKKEPKDFVTFPEQFTVWCFISHAKLATIFFPHLAPKPQEFEKQIKIIGKPRSDAHYYDTLSKLEYSLIIVKFADKLHNLRTTELDDEGRLIKVIKEAEQIFLPLAKKCAQSEYVVELIQHEIARLQAALVRVSTQDKIDEIIPSRK